MQTVKKYDVLHVKREFFKTPALQVRQSRVDALWQGRQLWACKRELEATARFVWAGCLDLGPSLHKISGKVLSLA